MVLCCQAIVYTLQSCAAGLLKPPHDLRMLLTMMMLMLMLIMNVHGKFSKMP